MLARIDLYAHLVHRLVERGFDVYQEWRLTDESAALEVAAEIGECDALVVEEAADEMVARLRNLTPEKERHIRLFFARVALHVK